ncbi:ciliary microtubule-associated protein 3-like [Siphateles boraxobius]|uniref:ciliary microtubule-associated protein 3-like n=1 Tax=Siphateles boraxobius TaxID=180520 RepID=UPI0040644AAB
MVTSKHQDAMATRGAAPLVAFGSCQKRLMFPTHFAHNRMGNEMLALHGSTDSKELDLGPGCYDNHKVGTLIYDLQHRPESKRGYVLAARTAPRFLPQFKTATPSPQKYQEDWTQSKVRLPGKTPFNSTTVRSRPSNVDSSPGPGAYTHNTLPSKRVSWPMKFGSPDWSKVPLLERRALRTELLHDKEFRKQRNRVAYLSLFY